MSISALRGPSPACGRRARVGRHHPALLRHLLPVGGRRAIAEQGAEFCGRAVALERDAQAKVRSPPMSSLMITPMVEASRPATADEMWEAVRRRDSVLRRRVLRRGEDYRRLLPAELQVAAAEARERVLLPERGSRGAGGFSRLQALPPRPARRAGPAGGGGQARLRENRFGRGAALGRRARGGGGH